MKDTYYESIVAIERAHRLFLEVLKVEIEHLNIQDINNIQCLIIYNIGKGQFSIGDLTSRGCYLGSNISYNLRKILQKEYLVQEKSPHDRRSSTVKLTKKGLDIYSKINHLIEKNAEKMALKGINKVLLQETLETLNRMEKFWSDSLTHPLK